MIDYRPPDLYLCTFWDQHQEWMALHKDCEQVEDYFYFIQNRPPSQDIVTMDDYGECAQGPYFIEGYRKDIEEEEDQ